MCHVYLAKELKFIGIKPEYTEEMKIVRIKIKDIDKMVEDKKIIDGMTISALALAKKYLIKK